MSDTNMKVALISAGVGLLVGVLGAAATVGGVWFGGQMTREVADRQIEANAEQAHMQIEADAEQAHSDFLRDKRISVYTNWLDNINGLTVKENTAWNAIDAFLENKDAERSTAATEAIREVRDHLLAMESVEVQLSIMASSKSSIAAKELMASHRKIADSMETTRLNPEDVKKLGSRDETLKSFDEAFGDAMDEEESTQISELLERLSLSEEGGNDLPPGTAKALDDGTSLEALKEAIEQSGSSLARLYGTAPRSIANTQYADFIAAARDDLEIDNLLP